MQVPKKAEQGLDADAEVEAMLDVERKQELARASAQGRDPDETAYEKPSVEVKVGSDLIAKIKAESDAELYSDEVEAR